MPHGRYRLHDLHDQAPLGEERFQCAPGPSGWRYVAQRHAPDGTRRGSLDLSLDARGRPIRLAAQAGDWHVRGAALDGVTWVRTDPAGEHAQEGNAPTAHAFTGLSPAFLVATARLLRPGPGSGPVRVRLVALTEPVLAPVTVEQAWTLLGTEPHRDEETGALVTVDTFGIDDLHTGERHTAHLAGDVVLAAPGVELEDLDAPPSAF